MLQQQPIKRKILRHFRQADFAIVMLNFLTKQTGLLFSLAENSTSQIQR